MIYHAVMVLTQPPLLMYLHRCVCVCVCVCMCVCVHLSTYYACIFLYVCVYAVSLAFKEPCCLCWWYEHNCPYLFMGTCNNTRVPLLVQQALTSCDRSKFNVFSTFAHNININFIYVWYLCACMTQWWFVQSKIVESAFCVCTSKKNWWPSLCPPISVGFQNFGGQLLTWPCVGDR